MARRPSVVPGITPASIEHWVVAQRQGQTAALNILEHGTTSTRCRSFGTSITTWPSIPSVGHAEKWDEIAIEGEITVLLIYAQRSRSCRRLNLPRCRKSQRKREWSVTRSSPADRAHPLLSAILVTPRYMRITNRRFPPTPNAHSRHILKYTGRHCNRSCKSGRRRPRTHRLIGSPWRGSADDRRAAPALVEPARLPPAG